MDDESLPSHTESLNSTARSNGESEASQTAGEKPAAMANGDGKAEDSKLLVQGGVHEDDQPAPPELPTDVRLKLRKLEKLESRYQGWLFIQLFN